MITQLDVDGYRLLNRFSADLGKLTVVIGANAVGKSTLINCLECISRCAESPLDTVLRWQGGIPSLVSAKNTQNTEKPRLSWTIEFTKPEAGIWAKMPIDADDTLAYEVVVEADATGKATVKHETLRRSEPDPGYTEAFKYLEASQRRKLVFDRQSRKLVPFDDIDTNDANNGPDDDKSEEDTVLPEQAEEPSLLLSQMRFFNTFPVPTAARVLLARMAFYPSFDVTPYSNLRTKAAEIKPVTILNQNGENLGTVLHEILTRYDYRNTANELREYLKAAYPTFEEIHCDTTFGTPPQVLVRIREKNLNRSMELWELSDGMLRFLCLATSLLAPVPSPFVAIDEPEAGLHPLLIPIVGDMIITAAERTQVLITTHSPDLLNRFSISDIAVMSRLSSNPVAEWMRPNDKRSLVMMLESVDGESLGDLLRSGELETRE